MTIPTQIVDATSILDLVGGWLEAINARDLEAMKDAQRRLRARYGVWLTLGSAPTERRDER